MELNSKINCVATLSATVHRKNGTVEMLGVISKKDYRQGFRWYHRLARYFGFAAAAILAAKLGLGHIPMMLGLVTTAGVNYMAADFASGGVSPTISGFKYHDSGTGTNAASVSALRPFSLPSSSPERASTKRPPLPAFSAPSEPGWF